MLETLMHLGYLENNKLDNKVTKLIGAFNNANKGLEGLNNNKLLSSLNSKDREGLIEVFTKNIIRLLREEFRKPKYLYYQ